MQQFTAESLAAARAETRAPGQGRLIFAGTPEIAATCLRSLLEDGAQVAAVLTRPDAPVGRRRRLTPSPVAQAAEAAGIPVIKADSVDSAVTAELRRVEADLGVVVAYGALLPEAALQVPARGWVNLHYSNLPAYRGAAPVPHALLAGETATAATVFQLERGMDTGPVHGACSYEIREATSAGTVLEELTRLGAELLTVLLPRLLDGSSVPRPQQGSPSFAPKLTREDAFVDPRGRAADLVRRINATIPEPGAWTLNADQRIKLGVARLHRTPTEPASAEAAAAALADATTGEVLRLPAEHPGQPDVVAFRAGDGEAVVLSGVQPAGKNMLSAADWHRGLHGPVRLGPVGPGDPEQSQDTSAQNPRIESSTPTEEQNA
ncbi:methionyl-tRNA formyltransferase [Nesterenkonia lutea]|uniref:Methionyl-tRNA formyltransferase n=1 Tax=Nesterenkonia lutea TaxID=272919 RepID=A0ABR9JE65_9MICC|nr:methionyl-tRNA formyltransferase [Nesterenkonia lutea]MBE1524215.1 methionyl-tRNA formyltransferase [Nesterenkonia lutea]